MVKHTSQVAIILVILSTFIPQSSLDAAAKLFLYNHQEIVIDLFNSYNQVVGYSTILNTLNLAVKLAL